ncbi:MAG: PspC domain-containing protein [Sodaliphilus sp.]|nr:PspC domain-containing protein [Sodaliphilus sp.]
MAQLLHLIHKKCAGNTTVTNKKTKTFIIMTYSGKRLYRSNTEKTIAGVLGGIAEHFDIDPTLVRLGYVLLSLFSAAFPGVLGYIIMWIVMPQNPDNGAYPKQPPRFQ